MKILGDIYKRHFSVVSLLFRRNKLKTIFDCTDKLLTRWRNSNNDSTQIHLNLIE